LARDIGQRRKTEEELQRSYRLLKRAMNGTIKTVASLVELRDPYTAGHQSRVSKLACAIAEEMGYKGDQIEGINAAGLVHDIGKISIPSEILSKPGRLNKIEFQMIKAHPLVGYEILKDIEFPWPIAEYILQHHERLDGSGYPSGLSGNDICMEARVLSVADVVEAMATHRPYRPALGIIAALDEISMNKGILYDPQVVDACVHIFNVKGFEL
jgi:putative nucleotidyltransferase with HDIG domain